jgi:hypothetical protein
MANTPLARPAGRGALVTVDLDEALVADAEVVGDLVEDDPPHLAAKPLRIAPVQTHERPAVDGDLVRQHPAVVTGAPGERDALIEAEQRSARRRLLLDHDLHVRHSRAEIRGQGIERLLSVPLELLARVGVVAFHAWRVDGVCRLVRPPAGNPSEIRTGPSAILAAPAHVGVEMRLLIFLHGTAIMHPGGIGRTREERVAQVRAGADPTVHDYAAYVPVDGVVAKLQRWWEQGAHIVYLSSHRNPDDVAKDAFVLQKHGFPRGCVLARGPEESYGDVAGRELPDVLIEDDCESLDGGSEITYTQIRPERRDRIKSIIVPEFGGIDHLPDSLEELLAFQR